MRALFSIIFLSLFLFTTLGIFDHDSFASSHCRWTGTWDATTGVQMFLTQNGSQVSGTYTPGGGRINGSLSGNTWRGTWESAPSFLPPDEAGDFELTISSDCSRATGRYRFGHGTGNWISWSVENQNPAEEETGIEVEVASGSAQLDGQSHRSGETLKKDCHPSDISCSVNANMLSDSQIKFKASCIGRAIDLLWIARGGIDNELVDDGGAPMEFAILVQLVEQLCSRLAGNHFGSSSINALQATPGVVVELKSGNISVVPKESGIDYEISTPTSRVKLNSGSEVSVSHNPSTGNTTVQTSKGSASVTPKNSSSSPVTVRSGEKVEVDNSGASSVTPVGSGPAPPTSLPRGNGNNAVDYDTDRNGRIDDGEFFNAVDGWIANQIADPIFFDILDLWISQDLILQLANAAMGAIRMEYLTHGFVLQPNSNEYFISELEIFDLKGQAMFKSRNLTRTLYWDGMSSQNKRLPNGVYFYRVSLSSHNGELIENALNQFMVIR